MIDGICTVEISCFDVLFRERKYYVAIQYRYNTLYDVVNLLMTPEVRLKSGGTSHRYPYWESRALFHFVFQTLPGEVELKEKRKRTF